MPNGLPAPYTLKCTVSQTDLRSAKELELRFLKDESALRRTESARAAARDLANEKEEFARETGVHRFEQTYSESNGKFLFTEREIGGTREETKLVYDGVWSLQISHGNHRFELFRGLQCNSLTRLYLPGTSLGMFPLMKFSSGMFRFATALPGQFATDLFTYVPARPHQLTHDIVTTPGTGMTDVWHFSDFQKVGGISLAGTVRRSHSEAGRKLIDREYRVQRVDQKGMDDSAYRPAHYIRSGVAVLYHEKFGPMMRFPFDPKQTFDQTLDQMTSYSPRREPPRPLAERVISPYSLCGLGAVVAVIAYLLVKRSQPS